MVATIYSLPPEILGAIFKLAHTPEYLDESVLQDEIRNEGSLRRRFLLACSLVSSPWKDAAQRELWREVTIVGEHIALLFLKSPARTLYPTERLTLWSKPRCVLTGRTAALLVDVLSPELRWLALSGVYGLPVEFLCSTPIQTIKSLTAGVHLFGFRNPLHPSLQIPFALNHLSFTIRTQGSSHHLNDLIPLLQPPPTSLSLILGNSFDRAGLEEPPLYDWLPHLKSLAPHVTKLDIDILLDDFPDFQEDSLILDPFLCDCINLTSVTSYPLADRTIQHLPHVESWTIRSPPAVPGAPRDC